MELLISDKIGVDETFKGTLEAFEYFKTSKKAYKTMFFDMQK